MYNERIVIEPAKNGYIVTVETEDETEQYVYLRRRQVMTLIGREVDKLRKTEGGEE